MPKILLVEDDTAEARLVTEAIAESGLKASVTHVHDGYQAMDYLRGQPPYAKPGRPHLIVLDLNLPRLHGRSVLAMIKGDPRLRRIPVIIVSTATSPEIMRECMALAATAFIPKAKLWDQLVASVREWARYLPGTGMGDDSGAHLV